MQYYSMKCVTTSGNYKIHSSMSAREEYYSIIRIILLNNVPVAGAGVVVDNDADQIIYSGEI